MIKLQYILHNYQKNAKETNEEVAAIIGKTGKQYGKKKNDEAPFMLDEAFKIAEHYNKKIDEIFLPSSPQNGARNTIEKREE